MSLKHALLAMLSQEKSSGYDLAKRFDRSMGFFWTASFQQIYRELQKLEKDDRVSAEIVVQKGKPNKNIYSITEPGREALQDWMNEPAKSMMFKDPLLIKVFAAKQGTKKLLLEDLETQRKKHAERLLSYEGIAHYLNNLDEPAYSDNQMAYETLKLGMKVENAWLEWAEELKNKVAELPGDFFVCSE